MKSLVEIPSHSKSQMNIASITHARLYRYTIPFSQPMSFNGHWLSHRSGLIIALTFDDGSQGLGEAAPLSGFSHEFLTDCEQTLRSALKQLVSGRIMPISPSAAKFALDCALAKVSYKFDPAPTLSVPLLIGELPDILAKYKQLNCSDQVKLKVARHSIEHDVKTIKTLLSLNKNLTFRLDANRAWSIEQAIKFVSLIPAESIDYIEEPCTTLADSLLFAESTKVGIALDESLQNPNFEFTASKSIKALIIKPTIIGGFERCLQLISHADKANIPSYLSSAYESSLGISQLQHLAKKWGRNQHTGFDTLGPLTLDIISDSDTNKPLLSLKDLELICQY